jgi:hypothetical protein
MGYVERVLFVVGPQDAGKSTTLRSMFADCRFGTGGRIPPGKDVRKLKESHDLSNERRLYLRMTSPHERGETLSEFLTKSASKMRDGRWCFAGALQPDAYWKMPDVVETVRAVARKLQPERMRVALLAPTRHGEVHGEYLPGRDVVDELLQIDRVEVLSIDGRRKHRNGLMLADFFDFS